MCTDLSGVSNNLISESFLFFLGEFVKSLRFYVLDMRYMSPSCGLFIETNQRMQKFRLQCPGIRKEQCVVVILAELELRIAHPKKRRNERRRGLAGIILQNDSRLLAYGVYILMYSYSTVLNKLQCALLAASIVFVLAWLLSYYVLYFSPDKLE